MNPPSWGGDTMIDGKCVHLTKKGERCKNKKIFDRTTLIPTRLNFCAIHNPDKSKNKKPSSLPPDEERCTFTDSKGRCTKKRLRSKDKKSFLSTCRKHFTGITENEEISSYVIDVNQSKGWPYINNYGGMFKDKTILNYSYSREIVKRYSFIGQQRLSEEQHRRLNEIRKIECPLYIKGSLVMYYIDDSVYIFSKNVSSKCVIYFHPSFRYFTLIYQNTIDEHKRIVIYDREKCGRNSKNFEFETLFPEKINIFKDRIIPLSENTNRGEFIIHLERDGVRREKIKISIPSKKIEILPQEKIISQFYSQDEIKLLNVWEEYVFVLTKNANGIGGIIEQYFLNSGMKIARYHFVKSCSSTPPRIFPYYLNSLNEKMELNKSFKIQPPQRKRTSENFDLVIPTTKMRMMNERRIISLVTRRCEMEYFCFVNNKIIFIHR